MSSRERESKELVIRKLTPCECMRLMGFTKQDYEKLVSIGMSDAAIYHIAGDSIVTTVLAAIIGELTPLTESSKNKIIEDYIEKVKEN